MGKSPTVYWGEIVTGLVPVKCNFLGNLFNNSITSEILKIRNKKQANYLNFGKNILETYRAILRVKPRCLVACEIAGKNLIGFHQNVRPPDEQTI